MESDGSISKCFKRYRAFCIICLMKLTFDFFLTVCLMLAIIVSFVSLARVRKFFLDVIL